MASKHPEENTKHEKDLPLMSNISDIHIFHYILQLKCVMENNEMVGCVTLFRCNEWIDCMRCPRKKIHKHRERRQIIEIDRKPSMEHNYSQKDSNMKEVVLKGHKSVPADEDRTQKTDKTDKTSGQEHDCYEKKSSTETGNKNEDHNPAMTDQERADTPPDPDFKMILDCNDIDIVSVEEVKVPVNVWRDINTYTNYNQFKSSAESVGTLNWICDKHSMSVWKEGVKCASNFPEVVRVRYKTKSTGQSLKWTIDQDRRSCVFTHGHWINNRSLFPSQDVPTAMATWQTEIQVRDHLTVVMGGDNIEIRSECDEIGWKKEYFNTRFEMPSSTLSVAIGYWETKEILLATSSISQKNSHLYVHSNLLMKSCRLIGPASLVTQVYPELDRYIPNCVTEVSKCLGPHPFSRLDILIVPPCFDSLGMAW